MLSNKGENHLLTLTIKTHVKRNLTILFDILTVVPLYLTLAICCCRLKFWQKNLKSKLHACICILYMYYPQTTDVSQILIFLNVVN